MTKQYTRQEIQEKNKKEFYDGFSNGFFVMFFLFFVLFVIIFGTYANSWIMKPYIITYIEKDSEEKNIYACFRDDEDIKPYIYNIHNYNGSFIYSKLDRNSCNCSCDKEKGFVFK